MSGDVLVWLLAMLQIGTAAGIVVFWTTWLRADHDEAVLPAGFVEHERAFVLPDGVLAAVLSASAIAALFERPVGDRLALVAAGMLLFLGLIDAAYFARNRLFARERGGLGNIAIVVWMLLLATVLLASHL